MFTYLKEKAVKLFHNETKTMCATEFWALVKNQKISLPVSTQKIDLDYLDGPADLDSVNGIYHIYFHRIQKENLDWTSATPDVIRDGQDSPISSVHGYYEEPITILVEGLEHDGVSITKNATVTRIDA